MRHELAEIGSKAVADPVAVARGEFAPHGTRALGAGAPEPEAADDLALEGRQLGHPADRRGAGMPRLDAHLSG